MSEKIHTDPEDQKIHDTLVDDISIQVAEKMSPVLDAVKSQSDNIKSMSDSIKALADIVVEEKKANIENDKKSKRSLFGKTESVNQYYHQDVNIDDCVKSYNDCMKSLVNGFGTDHSALESAKNNILKSHLQRKMQEKGFKSVYNSFNPEQGGFALQNPVFAGTFDSNPIQYPNIIDYVGTLTAMSGMVGERATYVGIDSDEIDVYETQELAESGQSGNLKLSTKEFVSQKFTTSYRLTTEIKDLVDQGSLNFDLIATLETRMQTALRRKLANRVVNALKNAVANQEDQATGKIGKLTMGAAGQVSIKNLFDIYDQLRERYIENNPIFFCNANFANALAQEVGENGQLITSSMMNLRNLGRGSFELTWAGNVLTIVTIPTKTPTRFDDYVIGTGNAGKLLGIFGDMSSLFKVSYKGLPPSKREVINKLVDSDGVYIVHDRMNIADGILETKAGYGIVCG